MANARQTAAIEDVFLKLLPEPPQRAEYRVRCILSQSAKRSVTDNPGEIFELDDSLETFKSFVGGFLLRPFGYAVEDIEHFSGAFAAGDAFAAAFILKKIHEIPREVDHACGLIKDDHSAQA